MDGQWSTSVGRWDWNTQDPTRDHTRRRTKPELEIRLVVPINAFLIGLTYLQLTASPPQEQSSSGCVGVGAWEKSTETKSWKRQPPVPICPSNTRLVETTTKWNNAEWRRRAPLGDIVACIVETFLISTTALTYYKYGAKYHDTPPASCRLTIL